jgi:hypothetical protein
VKNGIMLTSIHEDIASRNDGKYLDGPLTFPKG